MATASAKTATALLFSADSHVMEPVDLWKKGVPAAMRDAAPVFPPHKVGEGFQSQAGGWDPHARQNEMAQRHPRGLLLGSKEGQAPGRQPARLDAAGERSIVHREYAVVDRAGRLQIPKSFMDALDLRERARVLLASDHVTIYPEDAGPEQPPEE